MRDLLRETIFGRLVHLASGGKLFQTVEQLDPSKLDRYRTTDSRSTSRNSIEGPADAVGGTKADPEKGKDFKLVDWTENDQENPRNWSTPKKFFVTFEICLLTTSVYIGSAIYSAGIQGVTQQFGVGETAALLGLTLFVAGYALGPMIWVRFSFPSAYLFADCLPPKYSMTN